MPVRHTSWPCWCCCRCAFGVYRWMGTAFAGYQSDVRRELILSFGGSWHSPHQIKTHHSSLITRRLLETPRFGTTSSSHTKRRTTTCFTIQSFWATSIYIRTHVARCLHTACRLYRFTSAERHSLWQSNLAAHVAHKLFFFLHLYNEELIMRFYFWFHSRTWHTIDFLVYPCLISNNPPPLHQPCRRPCL